MKRDEEYGVLLLTYKRSTSLKEILSVCASIGLKRLYINVDGPKTDSYSDRSEQERVISLCKTWEQEHPEIKVQINIRQVNLGCSTAVLQSIDWAFGFETNLIILEDDCIPDLSFFQFCKDTFPFLHDKDNIMLSCGSQFAPLTLTEGRWMISKYALTWGWATTREKWFRLKEYMLAEGKKRNSSIKLHEQVYWRAGARRARFGYVDVWDTILVNSMIENNLSAILPATTLVSNKGDDAFATHTNDDSTWLHQNTGVYSPCPVLEENHYVDDWLKRNFYKIRYRHLISTTVSRFLDEMFIKRKKISHLCNRWV